MCLEGQAGPFVGICIKKQTKLNNGELKVRADTRTAAPLDPVAFFPVQRAEIPPCRLVAQDAVFGLAAESIQMSSGATGSTLSALAISGVQGVMRRETDNN